MLQNGQVAQLAVQLICNQQVAGSIPVLASKGRLKQNELAPEGPKTNVRLANLLAFHVTVAQLVEHLIAIQKVASSNLVSHSSPPFLAKGKRRIQQLFGIEKWLIQLSAKQSMWVQIPLPNHAS